MQYIRKVFPSPKKKKKMDRRIFCNRVGQFFFFFFVIDILLNSTGMTDSRRMRPCACAPKEKRSLYCGLAGPATGDPL